MLNLYGCLCAIPLGLHSSTELNQLGPEVIEEKFRWIYLATTTCLPWPLLPNPI